jgi:general secretion pathway protein D
MKTTNLILSAALVGGLFSATLAFAGGVGVTNDALTAPGATNTAEADAKAPPPPDAPPAPEEKAAPAPDEKSAPATPAVAPADEQIVSPTNVVVDPATGELKLKMQFHNAPLQSVLTYMSGAAGYIINQQDGGSLSGRVTVWSEQPVNKQEALTLVESMLNEHGYTGIMGADGRTLKIIKSSEAKHEGIPVILGNVPTNIPIDTKIVTQILPVRSLNAVSLLKDLQPLLPADTTLTANESGNALVMTDTQANIHRIAEIVRALDSVSSSSATIIVFPLKFADAKSVAALIKDLFPSANAAGSSGGGGSPFGFFSRFRGGGGGDNGGGGAPSDTGAGHTPSSRVTAVSDDHANALVVSAPDDLVPTIKELVTSLDTDVQDSTEVKVFSLKNADPVETATLLTTLFPDESKADDNNNFSSRMRFGFFGGPPQAPASTGESDHVKKLNRVLAVPDARTGSLVVTASKDMMPQIITIVDTLDGNPRRKLRVHTVDLSFAEPQDVLPVLQDLFPTSTTSRNNNNNNSLQSSALGTRSQTFNQQQATSTSNPFGGAASGPRVGSTGQ